MSRQSDPWAHRRGEPRLFAFLWALYLLLAVFGSVLWLSRSSVLAASSYGPAARIMLVVVSAGAVVLWPMVRLSQALPAGGREGVATACLADWFVVCVPIQIVIWPLLLLAAWPLDVVAALAAMFAAWTLLLASVVCCALWSVSKSGSNGANRRVAWMALVLFLAVAGLGGRLLMSEVAARPSEVIPLLSPFSTVLSLTGRGVSGPIAPVSAQQWSVLGLIGAAAVLAWGGVWARLLATRDSSETRTLPIGREIR